MLKPYKETSACNVPRTSGGRPPLTVKKLLKGTGLGAFGIICTVFWSSWVAFCPRAHTGFASGGGSQTLPHVCDGSPGTFSLPSPSQRDHGAGFHHISPR